MFYFDENRFVAVIGCKSGDGGCNDVLLLEDVFQRKWYEQKQRALRCGDYAYRKGSTSMAQLVGTLVVPPILPGLAGHRFGQEVGVAVHQLCVGK